MSERLLENKNVFVTGGSRDIGRAIVEKLLKEGAAVRSCYHHTGDQVEDINNFITNSQSQGSNVDFEAVDIKSSYDRLLFYAGVEGDFDGKIDALVLNASDDSEELNVVANNALVDLLLESLQDRIAHEGSVPPISVILLQSVPGHFSAQLEGMKKISPIYDKIRKAKYKGEASFLKAKRLKQFKDLNVKFSIVCPPAVPDTLNWRRFNRKDPNIDEQHRVITDALGLPEKVSKDQVGSKVVELIVSSPSQGYVEFFNETKDGKNALSSVYGPSLRLLDTYNVAESSAWMIVNKRLCRDHFLNKSILPGFLIEEAAAQTAALIVSEGNFQAELPLLKARSVEDFKRAALPGDFLKFELKDLDRPRNREFSGNVTVTNQDGLPITSDIYVKGRIFPRATLERALR